MDSLTPDIAIVQECAKPAVQSNQCLWFGDDPRQGVAVQVNAPHQLRTLPAVPGAPRFFVPVEVVGPINFLVIAVWAQKTKPHDYVGDVIRGVEIYRYLFEKSAVVLAGDLNSNAIWDWSHRNGRNHSCLVRLLSALGLESAYHTFHRENHGEEVRPTFYLHKNPAKPYHLDYCFIPREWIPELRAVEIGAHSDWIIHSDHLPLSIELALPR